MLHAVGRPLAARPARARRASRHPVRRAGRQDGRDPDPHGARPDVRVLAACTCTRGRGEPARRRGRRHARRPAGGAEQARVQDPRTPQPRRRARRRPVAHRQRARPRRHQDGVGSHPRRGIPRVAHHDADDLERLRLDARGPLVLDIARLLALADAAGDRGVVPELGFFFKDPGGATCTTSGSRRPSCGAGRRPPAPGCRRRRGPLGPHGERRHRRPRAGASARGADRDRRHHRRRVRGRGALRRSPWLLPWHPSSCTAAAWP